MNKQVEHVPVLLAETMGFLSPQSGKIYLDSTVGAGGHSAEILRLSSPDGKLIGLDRDDSSLKLAEQRLKEFGSRVRLFQANYIDLSAVLAEAGLDFVDGIIFDLGFGSFQIDQAERGFSFQKNGPLDMRMDRRQALTAKDILERYSQSELEKIIRDYGEEYQAGKIVRAIIRYRQKKSFQTTQDLVDVVLAALPKNKQHARIHPATKTFQALRIAVNDELNNVQQGLAAALKCLAAGGRLGVISFHSLEDRIVKKTFQTWAKECICPSDFPVCRCEKVPLVKILTAKPITASEKEKEHNFRARSAKLRVVEKIANSVGRKIKQW
ncbi:MAG: 16S rRNA (cytosine(1402)-N(4))-methyltransferase RsmH [Elusimicrobiota bacterium]